MSFTHSGAPLLMQRTRTPSPTAITWACWRDTRRSGSLSTRPQSSARPIVRPSGGSGSAVASGSVAPGRRVTRRAITTGPPSAEGTPQVGLDTAGIDARRELFEHAGDELLARGRAHGAAP